MKNVARRLGFAVAVLGLMVGSAGQAEAGIVLSSLGTSAPPSTLGGYTLTPFGPDGTALFANESALATPIGGVLNFSTPVNHRRIGSGWSSWSHGYASDVYYTNGATSLTMGLNPGVGAFYFYAEPNPFASFSFTATASDGSTLTQSITGASGAAGFGLYGTGGTTITSVSLTSTTDFAVGEFGISAAVSAVPEPSSIALVATALPMGLGLVWKRRRKTVNATTA